MRAVVNLDSQLDVLLEIRVKFSKTVLPGINSFKKNELDVLFSEKFLEIKLFSRIL